jgi:hypothetical protein
MNPGRVFLEYWRKKRLRGQSQEQAPTVDTVGATQVEQPEREDFMNNTDELRNKLDAARARRVERIRLNDYNIKLLAKFEADFPQLKKMTVRQHRDDVVSGSPDAKRSIRERLRELQNDRDRITDQREASGAALHETEEEVKALEAQLAAAVEQDVLLRIEQCMGDELVPQIRATVDIVRKMQAIKKQALLPFGVGSMPFPKRADLSGAWLKGQDYEARIASLALLVKGWEEFFHLDPIAEGPDASAEERNGLAERHVARRDAARKRELLPTVTGSAAVFPDLGVTPRLLG